MHRLTLLFVLSVCILPAASGQDVEGHCAAIECPANTPKHGQLVACTNSRASLLRECGVVQGPGNALTYRSPRPLAPAPKPPSAVTPAPSAPAAPDPAELRHERAEAARAAEATRIRNQAAQAFGEMKGLGGETGLKMEHGNTPFFGAKGVSPQDAARQIDTSAPQAPREVPKAWEQLHCAAIIFNRAASIPVYGPDDIGRNIDRIRALADNGIRALRGQSAEQDCRAGSMPKIRQGDAPRIRDQFSQFSIKLTRLDRDASRLKLAQERLAQLQAKPKESPVSPPKPADAPASTLPPQRSQPPITPADRDAERIRQVYEQQKKNEQQQDNDVAIVRAIQQQLNEINSTKIATEEDLQAAQFAAKKLLSSQGANR